MSARTFTLSEPLHEYLLHVSVRELPLLAQLRQETAALPNATMQISPEQGNLMSLLVRMTGARRSLEVGVFTGYSSLCVALALPPDGILTACDISKDYTAVARRYWKDAGVDGKIDLRLGAALKTLDGLIKEGRADWYDFAFIDADKRNYPGYYERALVLLRPGGVLAVDNVLWSGKVADPTVRDDDTIAIRTFNEELARDERIDISVIPIGDGLTIARKRPPF
jgi:predicted O-methyltransferase YrrM